MKFERMLTYDDVLLRPRYSDILSRTEVDIGSELNENLKLKLPIISSPMDTVTEGEMTISMGQAGGLGIIHRYNTIEEQAELVERSWGRLSDTGPSNLVGAAIGVTGDFLRRAVTLRRAGAKVLCIDVAHGHHIHVQRAIGSIREHLGDTVHIMAGNVATAEGYVSLSEWGADSVRCNVGGGSICSTRTQTGFGVPGLHTIFECVSAGLPTKIIADGGIKNSGDIVKALAAGADFVMLGSLLAGTTEAPGETLNTAEGKKYKTFRGMASKAAQQDWKGSYSSNEGISTVVPVKGPVNNILEDLKNGIRSGFSYAGSRNIIELQTNAVFMEQTSAGQYESSTHILSRNL